MERTIIAVTSPNQQTSDLSKSCVIAVIGIFIAWYLPYLWRRRYLYLSSLQLQGPFALPIVGSVFSFIANGTHAMKTLIHMFNIYPGIFRIWIGTRMAYSLSDSKYIEILLTSPHALGKEFFYRPFRPVLGTGLITAPVARWRKTRKIIHPTFNQKILKNYLHIFVKQSKIFVEVMQNKYARGDDIDVLTSMTKLALDSITETAMGLQLNTQTSDSDLRRWMERLGEIAIQRTSNIFYHSDFIFDHTALGIEGHSLKKKFKLLASKIITEKRTQYEAKIQEYVNEGKTQTEL